MFTESVGLSESVSMGIVPATVPVASVQTLYVVASAVEYNVAVQVEG